MEKLFTSASKIVFLVMAFTICFAFLFEVISGRITMEAKDFFALAGMAFVFYFSNKGDTSGGALYAGK
jgi:hypothetical protein